MPKFPLKIAESQRNLVDQHGDPFLITGDSPWSLITALDEPAVEQYLTDRAAKGFNALIVNLIEHKFNGPATRAGELPFHDLRDLTTPNLRYFDHAAWVISRAADYGMLVFLAPLFLGYKSARSDEGWFHEAVWNGPGKLYPYGEFIGQRFAQTNNIVWLVGCDRDSKRH